MDIVDTILELNKGFSIRRDAQRHFRREGEKPKVYAELRVFNGRPQLVFFYGKQRYTFNLVEREKPDNSKALMRITGYNGIDSIAPDLLERHFEAGEVKLRRAMLKRDGV